MTEVAAEIPDSIVRPDEGVEVEEEQESAQEVEGGFEVAEEEQEYADDEAIDGGTDSPLLSTDMSTGYAQSAVATEELKKKLADIEAFSFPSEESPEYDMTGKLAYLDAARRLRERDHLGIPTTHIVEQMGNSSWNFDLVGLGDRGVVALASSLTLNTSLVSLSLVGNHISADGAATVVRALAEAHALEKLDLSDNKLGVPGESKEVTGGSVIRELLGRGSRLQSLAVRSNALTNKDVASFADVLMENNALQYLDLSYNNIGYYGAVDLSHAIANNGDLVEVNLQWNSFLPTGNLALLTDGFLLNNTIKRFNLSWTGLDDDCATLIGRIISENAIEEIVIAHNRITARGAEAIAKGLRSTSSLAHLVLDDNPLTDMGCSALILPLESTSTTVKELSLRQTGSTAATKLVREQVKGQNPSVAIYLTDDAVSDPLHR